MQLGQLQKIESKLVGLGYQIVALSPDTPEHLAKSVKKLELGFRLFSDSQAEAAKAFGLAFRMDDETYAKYQGAKIDLEQASGEKHHILPVPGVFFVSPSLMVHFQYVNPNHTVRLHPELVLAAAKAGLGKQ